jgi:hypothetical protein
VWVGLLGNINVERKGRELTGYGFGDGRCKVIDLSGECE